MLRYRWKKQEKICTLKLSGSTRKVEGTIFDKDSNSFSEIDNILGKIQHTYIYPADIVLKKNLLHEKILKKCKHEKWCNLNCQQMGKVKLFGATTHKKS